VILGQIVFNRLTRCLKISFTDAHAMRTRIRTITAIVLIALGALWSLQGAGLIGGSFMSGERTWLVIGIAMVAAGLALLMQATRR